MKKMNFKFFYLSLFAKKYFNKTKIKYSAFYKFFKFYVNKIKIQNHFFN